MIQIYNCVADWRHARGGFAPQVSLGFVPTMGALHEGHLSLIRRSIAENDQTLVTIFVNPMQFNDPKDYETYPQTREQDVARLSAMNNVHLLFPTREELYGDNFTFQVCEKTVSTILCGKFREGHFTGVLTVVMILLHIAEAQTAYFGEKDFQQWKLVSEMAKSFFLNTQIKSCPTTREADGLAMSSRNLRLGVSERELAPQFYQILKQRCSLEEIEQNLTRAGFRVEYVEEKWGRRLAAVYLGNHRLIDNVPV
jgi:pantoate--beta-alanine ligase